MRTKITLIFTMCLAFQLVLGAAAGATRYYFQDLGHLGVDLCEAQGINDLGQVAGSSQYPGGPGLWHAYLWTPGRGMQDLGDLGGGDSQGWDVNNNGQVVGASYYEEDVYHLHAFLWTQDGGMQDLGTLGGTDSYAFALNDAGQVVGSSLPKDSDYEQAFLWTSAEGMKPLYLGDLGPVKSSLARGINNAGQVGGYYWPPVGPVRAFFWSPGSPPTVQDLGDLGGGAAAAYAINDLGQVVGDSLTEAGESHAFLWTAAQGMQDLGLLILSEDPVERFSWAFSINNAGQVVGESGEYRGLSQPSRPFIWTQKTGMLDLTTFIANPPPAADYYFTDAIAINNSGQIAGNAIMLDSGSDHSYRLAPIAPVSTIFPLLLSD